MYASARAAFGLVTSAGEPFDPFMEAMTSIMTSAGNDVERINV
jgi:hypothetical protein